MMLLPAFASGQAGSVTTGLTAPAAGYRLTISSTRSTTGTVSGALPSQQQTISLRILDGILRMDISADVNTSVRQGMYTLQDSRTGAMNFVDTTARQVMSMNAMAIPIEAQGGPEFVITDTASQVEDLGPGETVFGFATRKYRVSLRYEERYLGSSATIRTSSVATIHLSQEVAALDSAFGMFPDDMMPIFGRNTAGNPEAQLPALMKSIPKGFAMISDWEQRVNVSENEIISRQIRRVTDFARGGVLAADMRVPARYTTVDMNAMLQQSLNAAERNPPPSLR